MFAATLPVLAGPPPQHPFETVLPWSIERGSLEAGGDLTRRFGAHPPFYTGEPGFTRDEWRLSLVDATLGLGGGGEVRLQFGVQSFDEEGGLRETGVEDARLSFTWQLPGRGITSALQFAVKLPNAPNDRRLGTDETDLFFVGAVGRQGARFGWASHAGLGILGTPTEAAVQDDVLVFGAAAWTGWKPSGSATWFAEVTGTAASRFGNDFRSVRTGVILPFSLPVHVALSRGLTSASEDWGIEVGVTLLRGPGGGPEETYLP